MLFREKKQRKKKKQHFLFPQKASRYVYQIQIFNKRMILSPMQISRQRPHVILEIISED